MAGPHASRRPVRLTRLLAAWTLPLLLSAACAAAGDRPAALTELLLGTGDGYLYVRSGGAGADLVLLHGLGDSSEGWYKIEEPLRAAGYRVTAWDALGAGLSEKPGQADLGLHAHGQRLLAVLDRLGIESAVLIGNSLGGSLALLFARQHPERVRGLVLLDPAAYPEVLISSRWYWRFHRVLGFFIKLLPAEDFARAALRWNFADPTRIEEEDLRRYAAAAARHGALDAVFAQQAALMAVAPELAAEFADSHRLVACPTLILWGRADRVVPLTQGERLAREMPAARLEILPGVGHTPQLEAPGLVLERLLPFLKELGGQPAHD